MFSTLFLQKIQKHCSLGYFFILSLNKQTKISKLLVSKDISGETFLQEAKPLRFDYVCPSPIPLWYTLKSWKHLRVDKFSLVSYSNIHHLNWAFHILRADHSRIVSVPTLACNDSGLYLRAQTLPCPRCLPSGKLHCWPPPTTSRPPILCP